MILARFLPRDQQFFGYFDEAARNASEAAHILVDLFTNFEDAQRRVRRLRDLEHRGDEITHHIFNALNSTFVTPLDREDIRDITIELDDFIDYIEEAGRRLWLYRIDRPTELGCLLTRIIAEQADALVRVVPLLGHTKQHTEAVRQAVVEVNRLENEADDTLNQALGELFDGVEDVPGLIHAIRWGELYQLLENATDGAEHVVNTIEGIALKYA